MCPPEKDAFALRQRRISLWRSRRHHLTLLFLSEVEGCGRAGDWADKEMPAPCRSRRCLDRSVQRTDLQTALTQNSIVTKSAESLAV
jgi:hypothetical protein